MNSTLIKNVRILITLIAVALVVSPIAADARVNYNVITTQLRDRMEKLKSEKKFFGSENMLLFDNEHIVIPFSGHPEKGKVYRVRFLPWAGMPSGALVPQLIDDESGLSLIPTMGLQYTAYDNGDYDVWGTGWDFGQLIHVLAWSQWDDVLEEVYWSVIVTWGLGSDIGDPGYEIDRTHLGTLPDEPVRLGFEIKSADLNDKSDPRIEIFIDLDAEFILDKSTDLDIWYGIPSTYTEIPDSEVVIEGVGFVKAVLRASQMNTNQKRQLFRLRKR
jgi:hypothetical protein